MALTIEDGSVVAGADSFITLADARVNAEARGLVLSVDDTIAETQLRQGYYWLVDAYESRLQGSRIAKEQTGIFPRADVVAHGFAVEEDEIPQDVINAQVSMAASVNAGVDTNATQAGQDLASSSVDGIYSESYQPNSSSNTLANTPAITRMLKPYMVNGGRVKIHREGMGCGRC